MLALIIKGEPFEDQLLSFSDKEHKSAEYLKISPRGKVPALVDGDTVVTESLAIIHYVDRRIPSPPLFGETPAEAGRIAQRVQEHENYLGRAAHALMTAAFRGKAADRVDELRPHADALRKELDALDTLEAPARPPGVGTRPCANEAAMFFSFFSVFLFPRHAAVRQRRLPLDGRGRGVGRSSPLSTG